MNGKDLAGALWTGPSFTAGLQNLSNGHLTPKNFLRRRAHARRRFLMKFADFLEIRAENFSSPPFLRGNTLKIFLRQPKLSPIPKLII